MLFGLYLIPVQYKNVSGICRRKSLQIVLRNRNFVFLPHGRAVGLLFPRPRPGHGPQRPTCLLKFLPFSKNGELAATNLRFWPISPTKACYGAGKQELEQGWK